MKTYNERTADVLVKIKKKKTARRLTRCAIAAMLVLVLALGLFLPFGCVSAPAMG